jgi:hypothetical protein
LPTGGIVADQIVTAAVFARLMNLPHRRIGIGPAEVAVRGLCGREGKAATERNTHN